MLKRSSNLKGVTTSEDDEGLHCKVQELEKSLHSLRAEMDIKMKIIEEIFNNRNEQFSLQRKLLDREETLYQTVLLHWKNSANLVANGVSLHFAKENRDTDDDNDCELDGAAESARKRKSSFERRARRKRLRLKKLRTKDTDAGVEGIHSSGSEETELDFESHDPLDNIGSEEIQTQEQKKRVFVNFYSEEGSKQGERSSNPVWSYFLREESGSYALCCLCDEQGVEKVLMVKNGTTSPLWRHLSSMHGMTFGPDEPLRPKNNAEVIIDAHVTLPTSSDQNSERKISKVWMYFQALSPLHAKCELCGTSLSTNPGKTKRGSSTSSLRNHLRGKHKTEYEILNSLEQ